MAITGLLSVHWIGKVATQFADNRMYEIPKRDIFK